MKTYQDYGIDAPNHGTGEFYTTCPKCSAGRKNSRDKCLSVNLDKRVWHCNHCGEGGGLPPESTPGRATAPPAPPWPAGAPNTSPLTPDALKWLAARGISPATADAFGLRSCLWMFPKLEGQQPAIAIPFRRDGQAVNWKIRAIREKAFSQTKGGPQCLFNRDAVQATREVIITEGELDAMALHEAGFPNVCSCPSGAPAPGAKDLSGKLAFIDGAAEVFAEAERIILATDKDEPGLAWEKALAEKLGPERCRQVTWSSECKDGNDVLMSFGPAVLAECIQNATPYPIQGLATFADYRQSILDYHAAGGLSRGLPTGWRSVDTLLRLRPGTLNILTGIPSSGKSEWLDALMLNTLRLHKWNWAIFSPENYPPAYHFGKLAEKCVGKPMFSGFSLPAITPDEIDATIAGLSKFVHLLTFDEQPATVDSILSRLAVCAKLHHINAAIIDPWNELEHVRPPGVNETEHIGQSLTKFRNFARLHNVAVWIVAHPAKMLKDKDGKYPVPTPYDISGSANWRNKADACVSVWRDLGSPDKAHRVQIHVQKVRDKNLGNPGTVELDWQRATGRFFEVGQLPPSGYGVEQGGA
ncbi:MAG: DnaB-like helicase C-terminal domain-containing protein [Lentisphaeria bacterium]